MTPILAMHDAGYVDFLQHSYKKWMAVDEDLGAQAYSPRPTTDCLSQGLLLAKAYWECTDSFVRVNASVKLSQARLSAQYESLSVVLSVQPVQQGLS